MLEYRATLVQTPQNHRFVVKGRNAKTPWNGITLRAEYSIAIYSLLTIQIRKLSFIRVVGWRGSGGREIEWGLIVVG